MVIAELLASLGVAVDKASLAKADSALSGVANSAKKILGGVAAIFGGASVVGFVNELIQVAGELDDTSRRFGISTQALQKWRFAAAQTGANAEGVAMALKFTAKSAYDAAKGGKESTAAYGALGVSVRDSSGAIRDAEVIFQDTLVALGKVPGNTERAALAMKILGRGANDMLPLAELGAEGIAKMSEEFAALGGGFSKRFVKEADDLGDSIAALGLSGQALKSTFGLTVFPVIQRGVNLLIDMSKWFNRITKNTRIVKMALAVMTAGFVAWGVAALWAARQAIAAWLVAAAPILLVAVAFAAVVAMLDDVAALLTGGKSLIGKYLDEWFGVGTADSLVRSWTVGIQLMTEALAALGGATGDVVTDVVSFWGTALSELGGLWSTGLDVITGKIRSFADWVIDIGAKIAGVLDPTGTLTDTIQKHYGNLKDVVGGLLPDIPDFGPGLGALPGDAVNRANRDGSGFFDFAANPGVAAPDAVHPAFRAGSVSAPTGAGGVTVDASTNAPITVNGGGDPRATARAVRSELDARDRAQAARVRAALVNRPAPGGA